MRERINVGLSARTIGLMDDFMDEARRKLIDRYGRTRLRRLLEEGAERRALRDLAISKEWSYEQRTDVTPTSKARRRL